LIARYNLVIIGAGPTAIAAIAALQPIESVLILTGARIRKKNLSSGVRIHPKIQSVAKALDQKVGLALQSLFDSGKEGLFRTAVVGGLATYWGQQFLRYEINDPWPQDAFTSFSEYNYTCKKVENLFKLSPLIQNVEEELNESYYKRTPRLIVGSPMVSAQVPDLMKSVFDKMLGQQKFIDVRDEVVRTTTLVPEGVKLILDNGDIVIADKVILAAGAVGSCQLLLNSFPELVGFSISDHSPWMVYTMGLNNKFLSERSDKLKYFNRMTIERREDNSVSLFASVYDLRYTSLGLLLGSVGLPVYFSKMRTPAALCVLTPLQVWTKSTFITYNYVNKNLSSSFNNDFNDFDYDFLSFLAWLRKFCTVVKLSRVRPGEGFHYHNSQILFNSGEKISCEKFIENRFEGKVICVDSGALLKIGCRPHTLNAMAKAYHVTSKFI